MVMANPIAVFSDDFITDFAAAAERAAEIGIQGLAVRNVWGRNVRDLSTEELTRIRKIADTHGLSISALGAPYGRGFFLDEPESRKHAEALLAQMLQCAEVLGTTYIRIFSPWLRGHDAYETWSDRPDYDADLDSLAEQLAPSVRMAERAGMTLIVETEGASYVGQAREARLLIERLDSDALALCWDVANAWRSGERPWPDGFDQATRVRIADVHIKDLYAERANPDRASQRRARAGEGDVPYRTILAALIDQGYTGFFTVERNSHPRRPEDSPELFGDVMADLSNLKSILHNILGNE
jgi:sugar phosphate isomerase/epimerase